MLKIKNILKVKLFLLNIMNTFGMIEKNTNLHNSKYTETNNIKIIGFTESVNLIYNNLGENPINHENIKIKDYINIEYELTTANIYNVMKYNSDNYHCDPVEDLTINKINNILNKNNNFFLFEINNKLCEELITTVYKNRKKIYSLVKKSFEYQHKINEFNSKYPKDPTIYDFLTFIKKNNLINNSEYKFLLCNLSDNLKNVFNKEKLSIAMEESQQNILDYKFDILNLKNKYTIFYFHLEKNNSIFEYLKDQYFYDYDKNLQEIEDAKYEIINNNFITKNESGTFNLNQCPNDLIIKIFSYINKQTHKSIIYNALLMLEKKTLENLNKNPNNLNIKKNLESIEKSLKIRYGISLAHKEKIIIFCITPLDIENNLTCKEFGDNWKRKIKKELPDIKKILPNIEKIGFIINKKNYNYKN
jgi:hypothetical protein